MIPDTRSGLPAVARVSAMQMTIRRGLEREAMEFAVELMRTSKAFHAMACNGLQALAPDNKCLACVHKQPELVRGTTAK